MDILEFREQVTVILKQRGATFPGWDAELHALSEISSAAIRYMDARMQELLEKTR